MRFRTQELCDRCCDFTSSKEYWGQRRADLLGLRLQQLAAMASIDDVVFLPCETKSDGKGRFHVAVDGGCFLIISALTDFAGDRQFPGEVLVIEEIIEDEDYE